MPIHPVNFQSLSFEQANPLLAGMNYSAQMGNRFSDIISKALEQQKLRELMPYVGKQAAANLQETQLGNQKSQALLPYVGPTAAADLLSKQQENKWNPKKWQSEINLQSSQTGKLKKETDWYDTEAKAKTDLEKAQAGLYGTQAQENAIKISYLRNALSSLSNNTNGSNQNPNTPNTNNKPNTSGSSEDISNIPSKNSIYGIETPKPNQDDIINKSLFGIDTFTPKQKTAIDQQNTQRESYQKEISNAVAQANSAQKAKQVVSLFNNYMDKSTLKGPFWGDSPTQGWRTILHPGHDYTNEQGAEATIANMLPGAITELRDAMKSGQFSVADLNAASKMKLSRNMTDEVRKNQSAWLNGVYNRLEEKSKFLSSLYNNPNIGADSTTAEIAWQNYQNQFPLISKDGETYLGSNLGNWPLYSTPKAIASIKSTGSYVPSKSEKETFMMITPEGLKVPIKKGHVESAFRKGFRLL